MASSRVTLAFVKVKVSARDSLPPGARINPTDPSMSASCTNRSPRESAMNCFAHVEAPLISRAVSRRHPPRRSLDACRAIDANDGVRIEHGEEALEVACARRPQKRLHHFALTSPAGVRWRWRAAHAPARAARELLCRGRRPSHDGTDLVERHGEQIVQDERKAFGGRQRVEHDQQRHADRVREHRFAFGIGAFPTHDARLGDLRANRLFAP